MYRCEAHAAKACDATEVCNSHQQPFLWRHFKPNPSEFVMASSMFFFSTSRYHCLLERTTAAAPHSASTLL